MDASSQITELKGIGEKTAALFHRVGVYSLWDLMTYYPRDYESFKEPVSVSQCCDGSIQALRLSILGTLELRHVRGLSILTGFAGDETGRIQVTWFNMPYLKKTLRAGSLYVFRGPVKKKGQTYVMEQPKLYKDEEYRKLISKMQPVYSVTKGLTSSGITKMVTKALKEVPEYEDYLSGMDLPLMEMNRAMRTMHFPTNYDEVCEARRRLVFDEFFFFIFGIRRFKEENSREINHFPMMEVSQTCRIIEQLPYKLTGAQMRAWQEIMKDLSGACNEPSCTGRCGKREDNHCRSRACNGRMQRISGCYDGADGSACHSAHGIVKPYVCRVRDFTELCTSDGFHDSKRKAGSAGADCVR